MAHAWMQITQAAKEDIMCSDWSQDQNYVATGAGNGVTHVYDVRKFTANSPEGETGIPVLEFVQYIRPQAAALTVAWNPRKPVRPTPRWMHGLLFHVHPICCATQGTNTLGRHSLL